MLIHIKTYGNVDGVSQTGLTQHFLGLLIWFFKLTFSGKLLW